MDNANYINISRQSGLMKEMNVIANNIANADTIGFRREAAIFSEFVSQARSGNATEQNNYLRNSVAIGRLGGHYIDFSTGSLARTGGALDLAIDGEGFFLVETPDGERLTRAGNFLTNRDGALITVDGHLVLDDAGSTIQIPLGADLITIGEDGTMSANGEPLGKIGVFNAPTASLSRTGNNLWQSKEGVLPVDGATIVQGFLEDSNVNPILEISRMIEVQRAYEAGQKLLDIDNDLIAKTVSAMRQPP